MESLVKEAAEQTKGGAARVAGMLQPTGWVKGTRFTAGPHRNLVAYHNPGPEADRDQPGEDPM